MRNWYLLQWTVNAPNADETMTNERFFYKAGDDTSMLKARSDMLARIAVTRAIVPDAKFVGYALTSERLDWIK